jgi:MFS family permease
MSSLYLALAFGAGWAVVARGAPTWIAAGVGLAVTYTALTAFYGWEVEHFHLVVATAGLFARRYFAGGLVTGPLFGALGGRWSRRRSWYAAAILAASFILEPSAWRAHLGYQPFPSPDRHAEIGIGVVVLIVAVAESMRRWRSTRPAFSRGQQAGRT